MEGVVTEEMQEIEEGVVDEILAMGMAMEEVVLRIQVLLKIVMGRNAIHVDLNTIYPPGVQRIRM